MHLTQCYLIGLCYIFSDEIRSIQPNLTAVRALIPSVFDATYLLRHSF
ncbi:MAG: hypothetical protein ACI96W_003515 [Paraglaciecola sp.]|jgi:hypothetical protein